MGHIVQRALGAAVAASRRRGGGLMPEGLLTTQDKGRWPVWGLALLIYPLAAGPVAINVFMLGLMAPIVGLPALAPVPSIGLGLVLGIPAALWFAQHLRRWMDDAA